MSSYGYSFDEGEESKSVSSGGHAKSSPPPQLYGENYTSALTVATSTPVHNTLNAAPQTAPARQIMMMMKRNDLDAPMYSYTSTGAINWKALWNALLSGQHASLRKWVVDLPIKGCKVDANGQLDVGASALPPTFALQLDEMLEKAVPPLADLVIDALCWRGVFLPSELANFDLLSIRLARNHLLLRPAGRRENKPLSLEKFLPFGALSSFHRYMLTKRLKHNVYQHQTLRKTYVTWYKLKSFMAELDASQLVLTTSNKPSRPMLDVSGKGVVNALVGTFQQGFGYVVGFAPDGTPEFGTEDEGVEALRVAQELADAEMKLKIDAEIEEIQLLAAEALIVPNFNHKWLKLLGVPALKVHPIHIHHDRVSALLNDEIDAMLPSKGRANNLLSNTPSDQIMMLILFLIYKNSCVRAVRISMPLLSSNPGVMYRYLSTLVCKVAISSCTVLSKSNKRNQANCLHYLKMVQQYVDSLPGNSNDGRSTVHGLPSSQNYALFASMILDFAAILQRYLSMSDIVNNPSLSGMLPQNSPYLSHFEKLHLPHLMWLVFDALMKRRATRLQNESNQVGEGSIIMQMETETDDDTRIIHWFLALGLRLYKTIVAAKRSGGQNAVKVNTDSSTMLYLLFGFHMLFHEMFPQGFGELLRQEQCGAGPVALFCKTFLFFGGVSQESPMLLVRRILQLHDENFFEGELAGYSTSSTSDGRSDAIAKEPLTGVTCLEHLCLVLAPYSAILLASKIPEPVEQGVILTNRQRQERAASIKPIWDPTSESLLRIAFDPFTQNVLPLSNPAKASYLLSKSGGDEAIMALACGIGASAADCMLAWMRRNQTEILNGVPELPVPGPKPPLFAERSLPLEKSLLRLVRAGCWYTLCNGFKLFAPHNVLYSVVQFLKYFTQRRYQLCQQALEAVFEGMSATRSLKQPLFGRKHFFAVVGSGNNAASSRDINDRNAQSYLWTQRMLIQILRSGLLIGMQGNIPSSHRMANARDMKLAGASTANPGGYTSIDLTDYDRNFLMDLFSGVLNKYGKNPDVPDMAAFQDAEPVFTMQMMNEILSVIPPTVSSSFLLNITSINANGAAKKSAIQKYKEHKYNVWKSRLQAWREHETYYAKKINEVTSLLDLEQMSGVSIEERTRFIRFVYKEMDELELNEALQAALWYQISQYFYRNPHTIPDSLVAKVSNSSAEAAHLTLNAGGTVASSSQVAINLAAVSNPHLQDPEYFNRQANFEHTSERAECEQEILLLYLAMVNWKICLDNISQELDDYWARYPHLRPVPKVISTNLDGSKVYSKTELTAATDREGKPLPLPGEITNKLNLKSQYDYVVNRMIGRIHWLMVLHGMNNLRDTKFSWITFDLNDATSVKDFNLRQKEREEQKMKQHTAKLVKEAEKDAQMFADRSARRRTGGDDEPDELPETNQDSDDDHDDDEEDDVLYPPLTITFESIYEAHMVASGRVAGGGGNIAGLSYGLEKFHILAPSQYLPWNGSDAQTPNSAVQDAAAKHRAIAFAFDEDMDLTRLSAAEVRLLSENSVDTRFVLALIENLIHSKRFRLSLCVISDVLERFPSLRYTPRMQAAISLCDMLQFLFWLAHPTLQDIAINKVLSGATGAPFVGQRTSLVLPEDEDPYACCYKEVLDWPVVKHILREEDQTWMRMRWYAGNGMSNQTLMLQRLLVDSPSGSLYQNVLLSLLLADESSGVATVYSRTRPVGVDIKPASETSTETTEEKSGLVGSIFGTMKTLGNAFKTSAQAAASAAGASSSGSSDPSAIDVEHMRQWLVTLDEAARVELLDRFVQLANNPAGASVTATPQAPSGLSATGVGPHTLVKESFNQHYAALAMRHLPLLCEIAQFLAIAVRVTKVELTKPRNKKLQVAEQPGVRMSAQNFLVALTTVLTKTRPLSLRLPSTIPLHYASKSRLLPDTNSPTHAFMLNMAENLGVGVLQLLNLHPAEILATLWKAPGGAERAGISTLLQSGQCYYHFMNHPDFHQQEGEVGPSDLSAAFVQTFMDEQKIVDEAAGPPSPFSNFQQGSWWTREDYIAFVGSADRSASLSLATLGAAFRAQALVIIRERDPTALVSSSLLAANETASALIQDWSKSKDESRPMVHEQNAGEFVRLQPGSMLEFELLHASYICYLSAGRTFQMRQVAADLRAGLQQLLSSVLTKSKTPAPPIIVSPTNPNETIAPPFPGASVQQVEQVFLARLQLERCAKFLNNGEMRDVIINMWRQFKKKAPATFA